MFSFVNIFKRIMVLILMFGTMCLRALVTEERIH